MRTIATYIEYTLMTRHYAFVPGIGGFLLRDIDASYINGVYTPSHREVHFNRFLSKDDGMLANAYMLSEGISYDEAISQIRIEVASILTSIEKKKSYELGNLGVLSFDSDHHLVVKNPKQYPLDPDCYGLENLSIRPWREIEAENNKADEIQSVTSVKDAEIISIPKYWLRRAVAVIVIILCYFANLDYFNNDMVRHTEYASVFDPEILFGNSTPGNDVVYQSWDNSWESEITLANIEAEAQSTKDISVVEDNVMEPVSIEYTNTVPQKQYYIIIASCTSYAEAKRVVQKRESEGYLNVGIIEKDGRFRIYLKSFIDRAEGEIYLEQIRTTTPFQKAWLCPARKESLLSYYLKNIDNDQLPMELSHPYQRTERDQGWINT